jgi:hypothetical protein
MAQFEYYGFHKAMIKEKVTREYDFFNTLEKDNFVICRDYYVYVKSRLGLDKVPSKYGKFAYVKDPDIEQMGDSYGEEIQAMAYSIPWKKLQLFHKITKIGEYVDSLEYPKNVGKRVIKQADIDSNREYLKKELCDGLKTKKYGKNKAEITYDNVAMSITAVTSIIFDKKTGLYEIDWDA